MIFTTESVKPQIEQLLHKYSNLVILESNDSLIRLQGSILVHRLLNDFSLHKSYVIDIFIPLNSAELPFVFDTDHVIEPTYHHSYTNGKLCLETDSKIRIRFINGFNLIDWMDEFVEPYFVSYEYYQLYGEFPNGERQHGILGIIESYQDLLHAKDLNETYIIMRYIRNTVYRGHHSCPCGSKLHLRSCHGKWLLPFYNDNRIKNIMLTDLAELERILNETT